MKITDVHWGANRWTSLTVGARLRGPSWWRRWWCWGCQDSAYSARTIERKWSIVAFSTCFSLLLTFFLSLFVAFGGQSYDPIHCNDLIDVANSIDDIAPLFSRQMSMSVASLVDLPQVSSCPSGGLNHFDAMASLTMSNDARSATALLVEIKVSKWGERNANHWPVKTIDAVPTI